MVVDRGAQRVLEWWPPARQRALYAAIDAGKFSYEPKENGYETVALPERFEHFYMVVRREAECVQLYALYSALPKWKGAQA